VLAYPIWAAITLYLVAYHWIGQQQNRELRSRVIRTGVVTVTALFMLVTGVGCYKLYKWNNELNEGYTLFNSLFSGLLPIVDDPVETLDELGLDERLVQDVGKSGYAMDLLVIPNSPEGEEMVLSKVDTFDLVKYYITHPKYLYKALDISAVNAKEYFTWLFLEPYVDEYYPDEISYRNTFKFPLWEFTRKYVAPGNFLEYAGIYVALFTACIASFVRQRGKPRKRMLCVLFMGMMLTGLIQFPLAYIGNGMADPVKQMYLFMLSFDLTILISIGWIFRTVRSSLKKRQQNKSMKVEQLEAIMSRLEQRTKRQ
jgi:hypothetical protein